MLKEMVRASADADGCLNDFIFTLGVKRIPKQVDYSAHPARQRCI